MICSSKPWMGLAAAACRRQPKTIPGATPCAQKAIKYQSRWLQTTVPRKTDGVFRGLTDDRLPMPWLKAFKMQQAGKGTGATESDSQPQERDLSPRKMSDSYHRVVLPLGQDPWLSDTYLNSSGHIRLGTVFMDLDALSVSPKNCPVTEVTT